MCMARRKAALPSMVLTPRPSLAEFRAAPFVVNALEQDIRYRAQDREDEADANGRQPEVSVDRERQDGEAEIRQHRHHAETREDAGIEEKRIRPEAGQVRRHDDDVQRRDEHDRDGEPEQPGVGVQPSDHDDESDADPGRHEEERDQLRPEHLGNRDGYGGEVVGRVHVVHPIVQDHAEEPDHAGVEDRVEADRHLESVPDEPRGEGQEQERRHEGEEHLRIRPASLEIHEFLAEEGAVPFKPAESRDDAGQLMAVAHGWTLESLGDEDRGARDQGGRESQAEEGEKRRRSEVRSQGREKLVGREAREDPGERDGARSSGGREDRRNDRDGDDKSRAGPHVDSRDEEAQGHPQEERQERHAEEDPDARQSKVRNRYREDESDRRGYEKQDHVENRVPDEHAEERPAEPHRKDSRHGEQIVARPGRPLQVLPTEESECTDAEAVEEDAHMQEQDRIRQRGVCEQPTARHGDREAEHRDDEREGHEHRLAGIARVDPEFLFQHEAKEPTHRQAPTSRRNADSRSASPARIWSTVPVAMIEPLWMTATRLQSFPAISSRWEAMNAVPPPATYYARKSFSFR